MFPRVTPLSSRAARLCAGLPLIALIAACDGPLDYDLRGQIGAFNTTDAAQTATTQRPAADARGVISYPNYQVAVAERGDTVTTVATRIGLPVAELARYNGVKPEDQLRAGEVLALPRRVEASAAIATPGQVDIEALAGSAIDAAPDSDVTTSTLAPAPKPRVTQVPAPEPVRHKVVRGETAYTISRLYQVPVKSLAEWNGLGPDFAVREGQFLLIPIKNQPAPKREVPKAEVTAPGAGTLTPPPPSATPPLPDEKIDPTPPEPPKTTVGEPTRSAQTDMAMPVTGKIIRTYSKGRNEGIDIAAAPGTPVKAAADGSVAALTSDADGVPIIVVRHDAKLLTVYANVDKISVKKGDKIKRGQKIAQLRGGDNAYVHFEVRNGFDSVNPMPYLE
jgi:murein DD-endopeptidase MepM/ murein hydrolase activator NlpD